jgi:signal transduction histidine kinase
LHDNLNQQLASLVLDVSGLKSSLPESRKSIQRSLHELKKRIAGISDDVDRMARQLHPAALEQFGLEATLKSECTALSKRTGIRLTFRCQTPPRELSTEVQLCLYRLAQECLNNIGRHAKASRASVTLKGTSKCVCLAIEDSGVGFDPSVLPRERLGLRNMMERVRLLHGTFTVDSAIGRGTRIEARIPVTEARGAETSHTAG